MPNTALYRELEQLLLATDSKSLPDLPNKPNKTNWVEKAGGLPKYIERIAKHLHSEKGMTVSRAIATAVNTVKRWCKSGSVTEGGKGRASQVSAKTKAAACKAVASWESKKASTGVNASQRRGKERMLNLDGVLVTQSDRDLILSIAAEIEAKLDLDAEDHFDFERYELALAQERVNHDLESDGLGLDVDLDDVEFDEGRYELALSQERHERGIPRQGLNLAIQFNPQLHPRDLKGRFRDVLNGLGDGESVDMPDGTRVTKEGGSFNVSRKGKSIGANIKDPDAASSEALGASARSKDPSSVGGAKSYKRPEDTPDPSTLGAQVSKEIQKAVPNPVKSIDLIDEDGDTKLYRITSGQDKTEDIVSVKRNSKGDLTHRLEAKTTTKLSKYDHGDDPVDDEGDEGIVDVGSDVNRAADLLAEGKQVRLNQPREASVLLDELAKRVQEFKGKGEDAPTFDLCKVTVKNTNLFCAESKGIKRVQMPQLKGVPIAGSKADSMEKNDKGEVDLASDFRAHLESKGVKVTSDTEKASYLKPSQIELNGAKVAGMTKALEAGKSLGDDELFVSDDNYIVDGHHRWAAHVGRDTQDNVLGNDFDMPVARVEMDIIELLAESNKFAADNGIPQAGVAAMKPGDTGKTDQPDWDSRQISALDAGTPEEGTTEGHVAAVLSAIDAAKIGDDELGDEEDRQWDEDVAALEEKVRMGAPLTWAEQGQLDDILQEDIQAARENMDEGTSQPGEEDSHIANLERVRASMKSGGQEQGGMPPIGPDDIKHRFEYGGTTEYAAKQWLDDAKTGDAFASDDGWLWIKEDVGWSQFDDAGNEGEEPVDVGMSSDSVIAEMRDSGIFEGATLDHPGSGAVEFDDDEHDAVLAALDEADEPNYLEQNELTSDTIADLKSMVENDQPIPDDSPLQSILEDNYNFGDTLDDAQRDKLDSAITKLKGDSALKPPDANTKHMADYENIVAKYHDEGVDEETIGQLEELQERIHEDDLVNGNVADTWAKIKLGETKPSDDEHDWGVYNNRDSAVAGVEEWFDSELEAMGYTSDPEFMPDEPPDPANLAAYREEAGQIAVDQMGDAIPGTKPTPEGDGVILPDGTTIRIDENGQIQQTSADDTAAQAEAMGLVDLEIHDGGAIEMEPFEGDKRNLSFKHEFGQGTIALNGKEEGELRDLLEKRDTGTIKVDGGGEITVMPGSEGNEYLDVFFKHPFLMQGIAMGLDNDEITQFAQSLRSA